MHYRIMIVKLDTNVNYEKEMEEIRKREYGRSMVNEYPSRYVEEDALVTIIDQEQFRAVQKAVLGSF